VGMFLVSFQVPIFLDRYLVFAAPGFALLVALSIDQLPGGRRMQVAAAAMAVLGMAGTFTPWKGHGQHPSAVVAQVNAWRDTDTPVLLHPWYYRDTYAWHMDPQLVRTPEQLQPDLEKALIFPVGTMSQLPSALADRPTIVLVDAGAGVSDASLTIGTLRRGWPLTDSVQADRKVWVYRFRR
jgi:hypothetical protein